MENINNELKEKEELIESICSNFDKVTELENEIENLTKNNHEQDLTAVLD